MHATLKTKEATQKGNILPDSMYNNFTTRKLIYGESSRSEVVGFIGQEGKWG